MKIREIFGNEILNSCGEPTLSVVLVVDDGNRFIACAPSGTSVSKYAAVELRDGDPERYWGKGVLHAIEMIKTVVSPALHGKELDSVSLDLDLINLDGRTDKSRLGANTMIALSIAFARAQAYYAGKELYLLIADFLGVEARLPLVMFNFINGGVHAQKKFLFQEFMIMPAISPPFEEHLHMAACVYRCLGQLCQKYGFSTNVGYEGGFTPSFQGQGIQKEYLACDLLVEAIEQAGYVPGLDIVLCLDCAASQFYDEQEQQYVLGIERVTAHDMVDVYVDLVERYPIYSIEDGLAQTDQQGWQQLYKRLAHKIQLVGDDLFATTTQRIRQGVTDGLANAVLIKPNQVGTLLETYEAIHQCNVLGCKTIISHRSGETNDSFIADLAVGSRAHGFKAGACVRGERVAKYNRLLEIEKKVPWHG